MDPGKTMPKKNRLDDHGVHMPDRSWWPLVTATGIIWIGHGMLFHRNHRSEWRISPGLHGSNPRWFCCNIGMIMWALGRTGGYHLFPKENDE